eukprot:6183626-Pleurochrysis_carterae.AAC.1
MGYRIGHRTGPLQGVRGEAATEIRVWWVRSVASRAPERGPRRGARFILAEKQLCAARLLAAASRGATHSRFSQSQHNLPA